MIHTIFSNDNITYAFEKEKIEIIFNEPILQFTTYKNKIFGLSKYFKIFTFVKDEYNDVIQCIKEQLLFREDNNHSIVYINTCYNDETMTPEFIIVDSYWNYYIYPLDYDGYISNHNYIQKGSFKITDGNLLHAFQRDSYWYIIRTHNIEKATFLDIYFPNKTHYQTLKLYDTITVDAIINGYFIYLLFESNILIYNILNTNKKLLFQDTHYINKNFKTIFMRCKDSFFLTDKTTIYKLDIHNKNIETILLERNFNTEITICCYPSFDIKSNTHHSIFPYISSKCFNTNIIFKKEMDFFENICNNIYDTSFSTLKMIPLENNEDLIDISNDSIQIENNIEINLNTFQKNSEIYLTQWLFASKILSKTITPFYNILENIQNRVLIEFVKNDNTFGDSFILYIHPSTNQLHFVPDHSNWIKIISYSKNIKIPLKFHGMKSNRINMICKMIQCQKNSPYIF